MCVRSRYTNIHLLVSPIYKHVLSIQHIQFTLCFFMRLLRNQIGNYTCSEHSHPPHTLDIAINMLKQALNEASRLTFKSYRQIFNRVCNLSK